MDFIAKHRFRCLPAIVPASSLCSLAAGGAFPSQSFWDHPQKGRGEPHACSDARGRMVFAVRCGLTQQFSPARLLFYTIPFFIPFTVDSGL